MHLNFIVIVIYLSIKRLVYSTAKENQNCGFFFSPWVSDGRFSSVTVLVPAKHRIPEWLRLTGTSGDHRVHSSAQTEPPEACCPGPHVDGFWISSRMVLVLRHLHSKKKKKLFNKIYRLYFGFCVFLWTKCYTFKKSVVSKAQIFIKAVRGKVLCECCFALN